MKELPHSEGKRKAFLHGIGRAFDLFGATRTVEYKNAIKASKQESNAEESFLKTWNAVGNSFKTSVTTFQKKLSRLEK